MCAHWDHWDSVKTVVKLEAWSDAPTAGLKRQDVRCNHSGAQGDPYTAGRTLGTCGLQSDVLSNVHLKGTTFALSSAKLTDVPPRS